MQLVRVVIVDIECGEGQSGELIEVSPSCRARNSSLGGRIYVIKHNFFKNKEKFVTYFIKVIS